MANTAAKRRVTKVTEVEVDDDQETEEELHRWDEAPLFGELDRKRKRIELVSVRRTDPASGYLGTMPPDISEAKLQAKWGGGTYIIEGKNDTQLVAGARRTVKISGEPVFTSELEEVEYRRSNRLPEKGTKGPDGSLSVKDLLVLIEEKDEKRRAEQLEREDRTRAEVAEREARERKEREERTAIAARETEERKERERKDQEEREERRRREQREDDERRARIHREDMERMQAGAAQQLAQTQQFFTQMATTLKADTAAAAKAPASSGGEVVKAMLTGLQIARELMPGGKADPEEKPDLLTSLVSRLPEVLQEVRETAGAAYREMKGNPGAAVAPPARRRPDELKITGPTALKAKRVLLALKAQGKDPEKELDQLLTMVGNAIGVPDQATPASTRARPAAAAVVRTKQRRARPAVRTKQAARAAAPPAAAAAARRQRPRKARA